MCPISTDTILRYDQKVASPTKISFHSDSETIQIELPTVSILAPKIFFFE